MGVALLRAGPVEVDLLPPVLAAAAVRLTPVGTRSRSREVAHEAEGPERGERLHRRLPRCGCGWAQKSAHTTPSRPGASFNPRSVTWPLATPGRSDGAVGGRAVGPEEDIRLSHPAPAMSVGSRPPTMSCTPSLMTTPSVTSSPSALSSTLIAATPGCREASLAGTCASKDRPRYARRAAQERPATAPRCPIAPVWGIARRRGHPAARPARRCDGSPRGNGTYGLGPEREGGHGRAERERSAVATGRSEPTTASSGR